MRGRWFLAKCGVVFGFGTAVAQLPAVPQSPQYPVLPGYPGTPQPGRSAPPRGPVIPNSNAPRQLPPLNPVSPVPTPNVPNRGPQFPIPGVQPQNIPPQFPGMPQQGLRQPQPAPPNTNRLSQPLAVKLPQPENKIRIDSRNISLKRTRNGWQLWAGYTLLRDFGDREMDGRDTLRVMRDMQPTEWVTIGSPTPKLEYALVDGRPARTLGVPGAEEQQSTSGNVTVTTSTSRGPVMNAAAVKFVQPIDLETVRVEAVRGVWCLRDDHAIHVNFGRAKTDADQAIAVVKKYGFNRVGVVGDPNAPVMRFLFVGADNRFPGMKADPGPYARAALQMQIENLSPVGIPVPGVGFVGEMVTIDPRKLEVRKNGGSWVVVSGSEVIGDFGPTEWGAREAARSISECGFTQFGKITDGGLSFFLVNGQAPVRLPFHVQGKRFDPRTLQVRQLGAKWGITENGRFLLECANADEGETLVRVIQAYSFDQLCHIGPTRTIGVSFLAKGQ